MGSLVRSEEMALYQLFLPTESAYTCVDELGALGLVHFRDLNGGGSVKKKRHYASEVCRCSVMEDKLQHLADQIRRDGTFRLAPGGNPVAPHPSEVIDLETTLESKEKELRDMSQIETDLKKSILEMKELKHVLRQTQNIFDEVGLMGSTESTSRYLLEYDANSGDNFRNSQIGMGLVAGVIRRERIPAFERMLWRVYRGNVFVRLSEVDEPIFDPTANRQVHKSVFVLYFQDKLRPHVTKICEGFDAAIYPCPERPIDRSHVTMDVMTRLEDLNVVLHLHYAHKLKLLKALAEKINNWSIKVRKMKAIYHKLNSFNQDFARDCLVGECWISVRDYDAVKMALHRGMKRSNSSVLPVLQEISAKGDLPTYYKTNEFTKAFQTLIDSYGVARYRELNPTPYTVVTFPFLFAVMFGDVGHGTVLLLFATWMVVFGKSTASRNRHNEIFTIVYSGRYIVLMMGMFSIYTGFIYNDLFSKPMNIFGSHWTRNLLAKSTETNERQLYLDPREVYVNSPYPVGVDPIWHESTNQIQFMNSYKMKISIIFGVLHMIFGLVLSAANYVSSGNRSDLYTMFLPQIIFLLALFFYLILLVFIKWIIYGAFNPVETGPGCAPSILITFINMLLLSPAQAIGPCSPWMFVGQVYLQYLLVTVALLCVPFMLLAKPILLMMHKNKGQTPTEQWRHGGSGDVEANKKPSVEKHEDMFEVWIHQGIHTIEYVLGCVSHTASYLRLWALSLAHAQLSSVLWNMVFRPALRTESTVTGVILTFMVFPVWAALTLVILVVMEGLSAFLHTLRLHWVEFQSKFYVGDGTIFQPFSFDTISGDL